jgi:uncharacterized membrane protein
VKTLVPLIFLAGAIRSVIAFNGGLWRDEALFLSIVRMSSFRDVVNLLHFHESHPPLFYAVMREWLMLVGDTDTRALILPIIFGVLLVPVMFVAGQQLYSRRAGFIAAALVTVVPALNEYSAEARPYSLLPLLAMVSCWILVLAIERNTVRLWGAYALSAVALVYTHNWACLIVAGEAVAVAIVIFRKRPGRKKLAICASIAFVAVGLAYIPWLPTLAYQAAHAGHPPRNVHGVIALLALVPKGIGRAVQSTVLPPVHALQVLFWVACTALAIAIFLAGRRLVLGAPSIGAASEQNPPVERARPYATIANVVFITVPVVGTIAASLFSLHSDMLQARCFAMLAPLLVILLADRIDRTWTSPPRGSLRRRAAFAFVVILIVDYAVRLDFLAQTQRSNARGVATVVARASQPSDLVIVAREWIAASFNHYYSAPNQQIDFPTFGRQNSGDFADVWARLSDRRALERIDSEIVAAKMARRRVWLILDGRSLDPVSDAVTREALQPGEYIALASVRAKQIQEMLIRQYGTPDDVNAAGARASRYEDLHAFLFYPR